MYNEYSMAPKKLEIKNKPKLFLLFLFKVNQNNLYYIVYNLLNNKPCSKLHPGVVTKLIANSMSFLALMLALLRIVLDLFIVIVALDF